jgi:zinc transport system ATP-binding protein
MTEALVDVRAATVRREGRTILDHVDLRVSAGEIVTLIGPNGAGKSTLVKAILGLERIDSGEVHRRANLKIGYQPQRFPLNPAMPLPVRRLLTLTAPQTRARQIEALTQVGVPHLIDASAHMLSGGELQRVMLARALLRSPDLLVLDEPTQNVDVTGTVEIYQIIAALPKKLGCGVLVVSHDLNVVMAATHRVYCLNAHICCSGKPEDVSRSREYLALFGPTGADTLAIYPHDHGHDHGHHDHSHDGHRHG